ncbi:hypothetical protein DB31_2459 [Hyalangium minutum]|uniref:Uncharacterized protein n=1 Tax=Hyalangium minutum TaxID=394096 RepID=A0A085W8N3_9BACT|nr:hypothetical protein DB31_2459 [Hyalangium minutum]
MPRDSAVDEQPCERGGVAPQRTAHASLHVTPGLIFWPTNIAGS